MANEKHVARLLGKTMLSRAARLFGTTAVSWNAWRQKNAGICPDLSGANLHGANLREANLHGANLREANLHEANLTEANLHGANLRGANLHGANLLRADLIEANLTEADLSDASLKWANLNGADLQKADLQKADLNSADLVGANLTEADLRRANLYGADLRKACLSEANFNHAYLTDAHLEWANLRKAHLELASVDFANLNGADLTEASLFLASFLRASLFEANLRKANLNMANFSNANLSRANLGEANLENAILVDADLTDADLTGCRIYGVSAWNLKIEGAKQQNLIITSQLEFEKPEITVDNIEVAQFIHLMLNNQKVRDVIDTITSKAVLILGRFTADRKGVLDALRDELRKRDYLPILFDFEVPTSRDITETVSLLARMARFIIADLTDPSSIPKELEAIVPSLAVPVQPLLEGTSRPYSMFKDYWKYDWVLPVHRYERLDELLAALADKVIAPAEAKVKALEDRRRMIEAELIKPQ
jgi:uncharacterized protein YjbI with pentapeptide repeats